jgi:hypothetical protein
MTAETPNDAAISAMVEVERMSGMDLNPNQRLELDRLVADGLIEKTAPASRDQPTKYALTPRGQKLLDDRGVGVTES